MAVMRAALGSSENSAVQARFASSFQCTVAESAVLVKVTGPGRTPELSKDTAARRLPRAITMSSVARMIADDIAIRKRLRAHETMDVELPHENFSVRLPGRRLGGRGAFSPRANLGHAQKPETGRPRQGPGGR